MKQQTVRVDLKAQKEALSDALGDNASKYWTIFKDFIQAKLSKTEFDIAAARVLGQGNNGTIVLPYFTSKHIFSHFYF